MTATPPNVVTLHCDSQSPLRRGKTFPSQRKYFSWSEKIFFPVREIWRTDQAQMDLRQKEQKNGEMEVLKRASLERLDLKH